MRKLLLLILLVMPSVTQAQSVGQIEAIGGLMAKNDAQLEWCRVNTPAQMKGCIARHGEAKTQILTAYQGLAYPRGTPGLAPVPLQRNTETTCWSVGRELRCKTVGQ